MEDDLDEDDLDLIQDNLGIKSQKQFKKLRKKGEDLAVVRKATTATTLDNIFSDEESIKEKEPVPSQERGGMFDELDDFIVDASDSEDDEQVLMEKRRKQRTTMKTQETIMKQYGITEAAQDDILAIFGDGTEYLWALHKTEDEYDPYYQIPQKSVKLTDVYEPSEIKEKMLTSHDEEIRTTDRPERYQSTELMQPTDEEVQRESAFIVRILGDEKRMKNTLKLASDSGILRSVQFAVKLIRNEQFEVPFIFTHRKDYFHEELLLEDLWRIYDLDALYLLLLKRLKKLKHQYDQLLNGVEDSALFPIEQDNFLEKQMANTAALSNEKISDIHNYMQLKYGDLIAKLEAKSPKPALKRSKRRNPYEEAKSAGLSKFTKLFGIEIDKYISSLFSQTPSHFPEDLSLEEPLLAAMNFTNPSFPSAQDVLEGARNMLAYEISCHPELRSWMRNVYKEAAVVTVKPTDKGRVEIDAHHPFYGFKYLKEKSASNFRDGQFLQIQQAEQQGLVTVEIRVDQVDRLIDDATKYIVNDYTNENALKWNEERKIVASLALTNYLFPLTGKFIKEKLLAEAVDFVVTRCATEFMQKVNVAPWSKMEFQKKQQDSDSSQGFGVVGISWGDASPSTSTFAVYVNEAGELVDVMEMQGIQDSRAEIRDQELAKFSSFLSQHSPQLVVIDGFTPAVKTRLYEDVNTLVQTYNTISWKQEASLEVMFVDDDLCKIMMNSKQSIKEFPDYNPLVRYCVALCRKVQDPTLQYARLFNQDEDYKLLALDPLQNLIPETKFLETLERVMMNVVASCGVDINMAAQHKHMSASLQFVSGLGPRKAQNILTKLLQNGNKLESRSDLITLKMCGPVVFLNCASFLRVKQPTRSRNSYMWDILDDTRIHPEDYDLARKMAADAIEVVDENLEEGENPSQHVHELMDLDDTSEKLSLLLLDDYALELERNTKVPKKLCLQAIKQELISPFKERRNRLEPISSEKLFYILANETAETIYPDLVLSNCQVVKVFDKLVKVKLVNHELLDGLVPIKLLSDGMISSCSEEAQPGQFLECRVMSIDKDKFSVDLSARIRDVNEALDLSRSKYSKKDKCFDDFWEKEDSKQAAFKQKQMTRKTQKIALHHPFFKSVDYREAESMLRDQANGNVIIRPSTKGQNHLSLTWKVGPMVYQHIDIREIESSSGVKVLQVNDRQFSELDELLEHYIYPTARNVQDVFKCGKYMSMSMEEMDKHISNQCKVTRRSAYGFTLCQEQPGAFYLVYRHPQNHLKTERLVVRSDGYGFRGKKFRKMDDVVMFFKKDEAKKAASKNR